MGGARYRTRTYDPLYVKQVVAMLEMIAAQGVGGIGKLVYHTVYHVEARALILTRASSTTSEVVSV